MSELARNSAKAYEKAVEENLEVVVPDEYTLQLDIDIPFEQEPCNDPVWRDKLHVLITNFTVDTWNVKKSRSGNTHCYITLKEAVTPTERILLQAALGSDGKRELLSFKRLKEGDPIPTLLFEKKKKIMKKRKSC